MKKKLFSILLSLVMGASMMPAITTTAWAAESPTETADSVVSLDCGGTVTYFDNVPEAVASANESTVDCEIKILKDCSCDGGIQLNNTNGKVITLNTGDEGTELTIKATTDHQTLIDVQSSVNLTGNGGTYVADCNSEPECFGIFANTYSSISLKMYDGFEMKVIRGGTGTRGFAIENGPKADIYGGKILCPKENEDDANLGFSTIVVMNSYGGGRLVISGGEFHWDAKGSGGKCWAGVTDCWNSYIDIYDGYFDGPLWSDGTQNYQIFGGKYTTNKLKHDDNYREGLIDWGPYIQAGITATSITEIYNGTTYYYKVSTENIAVINENTSNTYSDLASGIASVSDGETLRMLKDLQEDVTVPSGKTFTIDLNGYVLKASSEVSTVTVQGSLTIKDSNPDSEHTGYIDSDGLWHLGTGSGTTKTINGGIITGGKGTLSGSEHLGGGVYVPNGGTFVMNGGTIAGCSAEKGSGVFTWGNMTMNKNSAIKYCTATIDGGGVCACNCSVTMNDNSKVSECKADNGAGGVYIWEGSSTASFVMNDNSIISSCDASANFASNKRSGGGVCVEGNNCTFTMNNGKITGNEARENGGGVHVFSGAFTMNGGTIENNRTSLSGGAVQMDSGTVKLTGNAKIINNTADSLGGGINYNNGSLIIGGSVKINGNTKNGGTTNNIYLPSGKTITLGTEATAPAAGMNVGVTTETLPQEGSPVAITTNGANEDAAYFASDRTNYSINYNTDHIELVVPQAPTPDPTPTPEPEDKTVSVVLLKAKTSGSKAIKLSWNGIDNATKYVVYGAKCGNEYKKLKTVKGKSYTVKKISGKKLIAHKAYKFYVVGYDAAGNKVKSKTIHFITSNTYGKYANVKSIKAKYDELLLSVGVTQKVGAKYKMYAGKKHIKSTHGKALRYISSNPEVAKVSSSGKVTAVSAGTATIYIQDIGGKYCKTKVTVER